MRSLTLMCRFKAAPPQPGPQGRGWLTAPCGPARGGGITLSFQSRQGICESSSPPQDVWQGRKVESKLFRASPLSWMGEAQL